MAGRPSLGTTKKCSITLSAELWQWIETEYSELSMSAALREIIENYYIVLNVNRSQTPTAFKLPYPKENGLSVED